MGKLSIKGLDKAKVLAALYNRAQTGGTGFFGYNPAPMTIEEARELLEGRKKHGYFRFDYLKGRSMKIDLASDEEIDTTWYDHPAYNGPGAAEAAIQALRETGDVNPSSTQVAHREGTVAAAQKTRARFGEETKEVAPGILQVGLADYAEALASKVDEAVRHHDGDQ